MRRSIVHQAKWLVLGLLKTTASALATTAGGSVAKSSLMSTSSATLQPQRHLPPREPFDQPRPLYPKAVAVPPVGTQSLPLQSNRWKQPSGQFEPSPPPDPIVLRLARPADVRGISACNLETLPENYNDQFYLNHLAEWPDLAFVAVLEPAPPPTSHGDDTLPTQQPLHSNYEPKSMVPQQHGGFVRNFQARFSFLPYASKATVTPSSKVVAYLLGKTCQQQQQYMHHSLEGASAYEDYGRYTLDSPIQQPLMVGHVSSLAVLPEFRRRGLADAMLDQFHAHLSVSSTGLHVRRSNAAAVRLYQKWGYTPAVCIPHYYEDGEDAYYMQKHLTQRKPSRMARVPRVVSDMAEERVASHLLSGSM